MEKRNLPVGVVHKVEMKRENEFLIVTFFKYKSISLSSKYKNVDEETEKQIKEEIEGLIKLNEAHCYIFDFLYMVRRVEEIVRASR